MTIDWAATGSMLTGLAGFAGAGAVLYAARIGRDTFKTWKRQKTEEKRMDAAERILTLAYRLRYNFRSVQSPFIAHHELDAAEEKLRSAQEGWFDALPREEQQRFKTAQAYLNRLARYEDDWQQIWELKPVALAYFGSPVEDGLQALWSHYVNLSVSADAYAQDSGTDRDFSTKIRKDLWGTSEDKSADRAIDSLETELLPVIRSGQAVAIAEPSRRPSQMDAIRKWAAERRATVGPKQP